MIIKPCTPTEIAFYESLAKHGDFCTITPEFMGTLTLSTTEQKERLLNGTAHTIGARLQDDECDAKSLIRNDSAIERGRKLETDQAIVLENVTSGFNKPNVLDVKLGSKLWGDDAPLAKRTKLDKVASETTSGALGFRIAGMRVWQPPAPEASEEASEEASHQEGSYRLYDKAYGRNLSQSNVHQGFEDFFMDKCVEGGALTPLRRAVLEFCEHELGEIEELLSGEESRMYSSSLLFVFEGDTATLDERVTRLEEMQSKLQAQSESRSDGAAESVESDDDDDDVDLVPKVFAVKLIDFAHAEWTPGQGADDNILKGIKNVRSILQSILEKK